MRSAPPPKVVHTLIIKADRLFAEGVSHRVRHTFPRAQIDIVSTVDAASLVLFSKPVDLLVCDLSAGTEGDVLEFLIQAAAAEPHAPGILTLSTPSAVRSLALLKSLDIGGAFDSSNESPDAFEDALRLIAAGGHYWSPTILRRLKEGDDAAMCLHCLTALQQLVLCAIGDGTDDATAALSLHLSPETVSTVRRDLHRKLGVQHRGDLVRVAAQLGFVHFTPEGVIRPGFASTLAAYHARRHRRAVVGKSCGGCEMAMPAA